MKDFFTQVLNMSLTASVMIVLVILARLALKRAPKIYSYALWSVVLFRLLCPVSLPSPVSLLGALDAPVAEHESRIKTVVYFQPETSFQTVRDPEQEARPLPVEERDSAGANLEEGTVSHNAVSLMEILAVTWLAGAVGLYALGIGNYLRFRRKLRYAWKVKGNVYLLDHIDTPFAAGILRPRIYLPSDLPENQRTYIVAHERCHIRRLDLVTRGLSFSALCLHWFNPLVWLAFVLSGRDMEMSCDEAVIRQLGPDIRRAYSQSLLNLSAGGRLFHGAPLAFGEGDTGSRIRNLARWRKPTIGVSIVCLVLSMAILAACGLNPARSVPEEPLQESTQVSATAPSQPEQSVQDTVDISYSDTVTNGNGSINYTFNIDQSLSYAALPVVEVVPHYLTAEEAQRVARVLFGDAEFYEADPLLAPQYTKGEIEACIQRWSEYSTMEGVTALMGQEDTFTLEKIQQKIAELTAMYDTAPEDSIRIPCRWEFQKEAVYTYSPEEAASIDTSLDNDAIMATCQVNGVTYQFHAVTRNQADYKLNELTAYPDDTKSPLSIDTSIYRARLTRTDPPTEEQIDGVKEKAMEMLQQMDLGDWMVDQCYVRSLGEEILEHVICIAAVPVVDNVAVAYQSQISGLNSDEPDSSNYYMTGAQFEFSANGDLLYFSMSSPIDVKQVVQEQAEPMDLETLLDAAKQYLSVDVSAGYGLLDPSGILSESLETSVEISQLRYGLLRQKVPGTPDSYTYAPGVILYGTYENIGAESRQVYNRSLELYPILAINALDGTIVN